MNESTVRRRKPYFKFKAFLVEKGIKQSEVAELLGKSTFAFNQKVNGTGGDFTMTEVKLICQNYEISADGFFL
jgi:predicted transcriptional regulator